MQLCALKQTGIRRARRVRTAHSFLGYADLIFDLNICQESSCAPTVIVSGEEQQEGNDEDDSLQDGASAVEAGEADGEEEGAQEECEEISDDEVAITGVTTTDGFRWQAKKQKLDDKKVVERPVVTPEKRRERNDSDVKRIYMDYALGTMVRLHSSGAISPAKLVPTDGSSFLTAQWDDGSSVPTEIPSMSILLPTKPPPVMKKPASKVMQKPAASTSFVAEASSSEAEEEVEPRAPADKKPVSAKAKVEKQKPAEIAVVRSQKRKRRASSAGGASGPSEEQAVVQHAADDSLREQALVPHDPENRGPVRERDAEAPHEEAEPAPVPLPAHPFTVKYVCAKDQTYCVALDPTNKWKLPGSQPRVFL